MVAWRVAPALDELLTQLNAGATARSKESDGSIGDAAHASRDSDHNPWYYYDGMHWVTARDFTHDPANGLDGARLVSSLVHVKDHRIKYVIHNHLIYNSRPVVRGGRVQPAWAALPYLGTNPHEHHVHVSVLPDPISLEPYAWLLPGVFDMEDDDVATPADLWGFPVHNLYTTDPDDVMSAGVALEWAMTRSAQANDAAQAALSTSQRCEQKLDQLIALFGPKQ
jgi:hypothetical protein